MGEKREFLANKQQGSCYLWMSFCGLAPAAEEVVMWGRAAGRLAGETLVGLCLRCLLWRKQKHELRNWWRVALTLELAACFCAAWDLASTELVVSGFEDAFFLSWHTDLKGVVTYYISHLLIHATYINIFKCLSWWINDFHNLVLVFSSVSSGVFKLFLWFGICSLTKASGVVFLLGAFLLWSVAQYKSSVRLACSGIHECAFCRCTLKPRHVTQYVLFPNTSLILRFGGYRHWISTVFKRTVRCINACSYLYNCREVIDCRGRFSNSDMTRLEHPNLGRHYQLRFVPNLSVLRCSWCVRHTEGIAVVGRLVFLVHFSS